MTLHASIIEVWFKFYKYKTGETYVFDGRDGRHIKQLITKIKIKVKEKGIEETDENIINSFRGFLASLTDQWILDNLDVSIINSKFNIIYARAIRTSPFAKRVDDLIDREISNSKRANG